MEKAGLDTAATKLLVQHMYTKPRLIKFLEDNLPNVKPEQRRALVIGAAAGARYAALVHCAGEPIHCTGVCIGVQGNQHSPVQSLLTFWNHGLSDEVYIPSPSTPVKSTANGDNGEGKFVVPRHTTLYAVDLADLQLPVSMDALCQEFDAITALIMAADIPNGTPEINMCHHPVAI